MLNLIEINESNKQSIINKLVYEENDYDGKLMQDVKNIIDDVKLNKDEALRKYTKLFDKLEISDFQVTNSEMNSALKKVEKEFTQAMIDAKENILRYHEKQQTHGYIMTEDNGVYLGQRVMPLNRVGIYVPGGTAAYPSTVLMNVIPAKCAGVSEIIMLTPPDKDGNINPYIAAASKIAGVDKIYKAGGAQAIAAMAYGTETIPKVDKIVGPGNVYVAAAKKLVFGSVDIDMIAGPSEILIISDEKSDPSYIAADLMSQAEHDKNASAVLITTSKDLYEKVERELAKQIIDLSRKEIIESSLKNNGKAIIVDSIEEAIEMSNVIAPEHLEIMTDDAMQYLGQVRNAGSIFLGRYCPEPVGDYFGGTNHVLPTGGTARFFSPLSVDSFIKKSSFISYSEKAIKSYGKEMMLMAEKEGLTAHANSIKVRMKNL